ncbi:MAG: hypothetical protein ABW019_15105 [Chitinophagaceae bacterium]
MFAYDAPAASGVFYSRMKDKLEEHIDNLGFPRYIIFRPGLLFAGIRTVSVSGSAPRY